MPINKPPAEQRAEKILKQVEFGDYLIQLRNERGISLSQLGEAIGLSANHLSEVERARKPASDCLVRSLAKFFGFDEDEFFERLGRVPVLANEYLEKSTWLQRTLSELRTNRRLTDDERDELEQEMYEVYKRFLEGKK